MCVSCQREFKLSCTPPGSPVISLHTQREVLCCPTLVSCGEGCQAPQHKLGLQAARDQQIEHTRHMKRPAEGIGAPAYVTVKQMATQTHRRWPRFTHALPLSTCRLRSLVLQHNLLLLLSPSFHFLCVCCVGISLSTSGNIRFSFLDIYFSFSPSLSLPD